MFRKVVSFLNITCNVNSGSPHGQYPRTLVKPGQSALATSEELPMKTISKALVGTVAAGAMAMSAAAPAFAGDRDRDRGISAGDIIAGAVILGGIAAIASASSNRGDRYNDRRYNDRRGDRRGYRGNRGNGERAVQRCIRAAERDAQRYGYGYANVTQIRDVDRTRYGWRVKGRIQVDGARGHNGRGYRNHGYNRGDRYNNRGNQYGRYGRNDHRGYRSADRGKFTCDISRGRVVDVNFRGIRGLR